MLAPDLTAAAAHAAYESVRARLPRVPEIAGERARHPDLSALTDRFDLFLLDAFGVLNIGESAIPGVVGRMRDLRARGKRLMVLTNAATVPTRGLVAKYRRLGYDFTPDEVVSSRDALRAALPDDGRLWGAMVPEDAPLDDFPGRRLLRLGDAAADYDRADGFLLLGSGGWTMGRQTLLESALLRRPRDLLVGNPDLVAPREEGFTLEPGHFAHLCAETAGARPRFFGKPFRNIYDLAIARQPDFDPGRSVMVGDSLHTDVLGARVAGVAAALVTGWGFWAGADPGAAIEASGLVPDFLLDRP